MESIHTYYIHILSTLIETPVDLHIHTVASNQPIMRQQCNTHGVSTHTHAHTHTNVARMHMYIQYKLKLNSE